MKDAIKRYLDTAQSLTEIPRERAERVARRLSSSGVIDPSQIRGVASDLVERSRENRRRVTDLVTTEIRRQISRLGLATKDDVERLRQRVQALEVSARAQRKKPPTAARAAAPAPVRAKKKPVTRGRKTPARRA
jgi:polyhydroxyalkanoate synthesis regulator phasin